MNVSLRRNVSRTSHFSWAMPGAMIAHVVMKGRARSEGDLPTDDAGGEVDRLLTPLRMFKETMMMRDVILGWGFACRFFSASLVIALLLLGCTRELEEKLAGKERELSDTQTALKGVQEKLAALDATHAKQSEQVREVERQRDDLIAHVKTLEETRATLEQSLSQSQAELTQRQQALDRLLQDQQTLTGQLTDREARIAESTRQREELGQQVRTLEQSKLSQEQALTKAQEE